MRPLNARELIAPCGMNCGVCMAYLRERNRCPGCRANSADKPVTRVRCKILNCPAMQKGRFKFCFQCNAFPCAALKHLDNRYRTKYRMSMIENLGNIKKAGIRKFVSAEKKRWACPACGGTVCVNKGRCACCGKQWT